MPRTATISWALLGFVTAVTAIVLERVSRPPAPPKMSQEEFDKQWAEIWKESLQ